MYRATTPVHTFTLPISTDTLAEILVSYKQGSVKLDKHYQDGVLPSGMTLDGSKVIVKLTQDETNLFKPNAQADVQVRVLTVSGDAHASKRFGITINSVINDEVLA